MVFGVLLKILPFVGTVTSNFEELCLLGKIGRIITAISQPGGYGHIIGLIMVRLISLKQKMENLIFKWPCTPLMLSKKTRLKKLFSLWRLIFELFENKKT